MGTKIEVGQWWAVQTPQGCEVEDQTVKLADGQSAKLGPDEPMGFDVVTVHSKESETIVKVNEEIGFPITLVGEVETSLEPGPKFTNLNGEPITIPGKKVFTLTNNATLKLGQTQHYDPLKIMNMKG